MKIEELKIITGTPDEVAAQAQAYIDEHPNSQILASAVTMKRGPVIEPLPLETVADETTKGKGESKDKDKAKEGEKPAVNPATGALPPVAPPAVEPVATALQAIEYGPDEPVVALTLGRVF